MKVFLLAAAAVLAENYETDLAKITVGSVKCNGVDQMTIDLETSATNQAGHIIGQFTCPGSATGAVKDLDFDTSANTVSFNPYDCNGDADPVPGVPFSQFSVATTLNFHLMFQSDVGNILLHAYSVDANCEFKDSYSVSSDTDMREVTSTTAKETYSLENTFSLQLGATNLDANGQPSFRANTLITADVIHTDAANGGSFSDLSSKVEWAVTECNVDNNVAGAGNKKFSLYDAENNDGQGGACGVGHLNWDLSYDEDANEANRAIGWSFEYMAFVFGNDAEGSRMEYVLGCTVKLCNIDNTSSGCAKAKSCGETSKN